MQKRVVDRIEKYRSAGFQSVSSLNDTLQSIDINIVELCNRTCAFCPRGNGTYKNQNKHMSLDMFGMICEQLQHMQYKNNLTLAGFSEPLLHNNFIELLHVVGHYNLKLNRFEIITNGDFLTHQLIDQIQKTEITSICVSMYDGQEQEKKLISMFEQCGFDRYILRRCYVDNMFINNRAGSVSEQISPPSMDDINRPCYIPFYKLVIDYNGNYMLCTQDWQKQATTNNINVRDMSIEKYWMSDIIQQYRQVLSVNRCIKPCEMCNIKGNVHGKESFDYLINNISH